MARCPPRSSGLDDHVGLGRHEPDCGQAAAENGYPMDHFIGNWWSGSDDDGRGGGQAAKGYLSLNFNGLGANYPAIQDIQKHVVDKGKSQVEKDKVAREFLQPRCLQLGASSPKRSATRRRYPARKS